MMPPPIFFFVMRLVTAYWLFFILGYCPSCGPIP